MQQRLSAVTLAVADLARSRRFYETLGWTPGFAGGDVAFYLPARSGGVCLAHNLADRASVDALLAQAKAAGAHLVPAAAREWGGYSGHFRDPDGHTWEIAWNPAWPLDANGNVHLALA
jgi:predicted lactoylglutathione lyase